MSEIKGAKPVGAARSLGDDRATVSAAEPVASVEAAAAADPLVALFDAVQARFPGGIAPAERSTAVRAVVDEVLGQEMGHLAAPTRAGVADKVTQALLTHPELSARLDRLLSGS